MGLIKLAGRTYLTLQILSLTIVLSVPSYWEEYKKTIPRFEAAADSAYAQQLRASYDVLHVSYLRMRYDPLAAERGLLALGRVIAAVDSSIPVTVDVRALARYLQDFVLVFPDRMELRTFHEVPILLRSGKIEADSMFCSDLAGFWGLHLFSSRLDPAIDWSFQPPLNQHDQNLMQSLFPFRLQYEMYETDALRNKGSPEISNFGALTLSEFKSMVENAEEAAARSSSMRSEKPPAVTIPLVGLPMYLGQFFVVFPLASALLLWLTVVPLERATYYREPAIDRSGHERIEASWVVIAVAGSRSRLDTQVLLVFLILLPLFTSLVSTFTGFLLPVPPYSNLYGLLYFFSFLVPQVGALLLSVWFSLRMWRAAKELASVKTQCK